MPIQPIYLKVGQIGTVVLFSSKTAPRIFIFSIALGAEYSFYVKSIATNAPTFGGNNDSVLAIVSSQSWLISQKWLLTAGRPLNHE